jgi:hypothetical protein
MNEGQKRNMLEKGDALPSLVFLVDQDMSIQEYKATASVFLMAEGMTVLERRVGEIMHCIHSGEMEVGCGGSPFCKKCIIRNSVTGAIQGDRIIPRWARIELIRDKCKKEINALITASPVSFQNKPLVLLVVEIVKGG